MEQIKSSFGLTITDKIGTQSARIRRNRQIIISDTAIITSLVTYFTTKESISRSTGDSNDELIDSTKHIIAAIKIMERVLCGWNQNRDN